jgi:hypothetical protein
MDVSGDEIAEAVLQEFDKWPTKRKPLQRGDGVKEWVPLSGIVAQGETPKSGGQDHRADNISRKRQFEMLGCSVSVVSSLPSIHLI